MTHTVTATETAIISEIATRAVAMGKRFGQDVGKLNTMMDVSATHNGGCPLKLAELAAADDANFAHDVFGIRRHLDRRTGKLGDCFLPRFAA